MIVVLVLLTVFVVKIVEKEARWEANLVNETTGSVRAFSALENVYLFVVSCQIFNVVFVAGVCCCCCFLFVFLLLGGFVLSHFGCNLIVASKEKPLFFLVSLNFRLQVNYKFYLSRSLESSNVQAGDDNG